MKNYYSIILFFLLFVSNLIAQNDTISLCESNKTVEKIWFDTDIMIGKKGIRPKEVDDGITFIMALKQEQIEIVGISNITHVDYGAEVLQQLMTWHAPNKNIPIYKGSPEANDLGKDNAAVLAMREALLKEPLTILALGPLTNVATLIQNYPEVIPKIIKIVMCAARTEDTPFKLGESKINAYDYNFDIDPAAMKVLLQSSVPIIFAGFESSSSLLISENDWNVLDLNLTADVWLYEAIRPLMKFNKMFVKLNGVIPYDATPLGIITHPEYFTFLEDIPVVINNKKNDARLVQPFKKNKEFLEVSYSFKSDKKATFVLAPKPGFKAHIIKTLSVNN